MLWLARLQAANEKLQRGHDSMRTSLARERQDRKAAQGLLYEEREQHERGRVEAARQQDSMAASAACALSRRGGTKGRSGPSMPKSRAARPATRSCSRTLPASMSSRVQTSGVAAAPGAAASFTAFAALRLRRLSSGTVCGVTCGCIRGASLHASSCAVTMHLAKSKRIETCLLRSLDDALRTTADSITFLKDN